jgi:hypothetical protein
MKPNIFLHYWSPQDQLLSFQEVLSRHFDPAILATIQTELWQQMTSEAIQEKLPNFDWNNIRMQEKWNSIAQTLVMQVQLPEQIWMDWIQALGGENTLVETEIPSFADLLNAEVYYERPSDSLEEMKEEEDKEEVIEFSPNVETEEVELQAIEEEIEEVNFVPEIQIEVNDLQAVAWEVENPKDEPIIQTTPDYFEVSNELPELNDFTPDETKSQSIKDMLADSTEEKVLDTIQVDDHSLKNMVANQMTSSLAESISLFQRLNFIQELFDGNAEEFSQFIEFIDYQASPSLWKSEIAERYKFSDSSAWQELNVLIERKFS